MMQATISIDHSSLGETGLTIEQLREAVSNALSKLNCPVTGNPIFFNGVQVLVDTLSPSAAIPSGQTFVSLESTEIAMTEQNMQDRIELLSSEMDANDEENRFMQTEIDALYTKIDAAKVATN
ncbi:MAG: hypothetical protein Q7K26_06640 [bacterium]|nr:hypothetical protein [bacterium]